MADAIKPKRGRGGPRKNSGRKSKPDSVRSKRKARAAERAKAEAAPKPKPQTPPKIGRPSSYTDDLAEEVLSRIAMGETLPRICEDEHIPDRKTIWRWSEAHEEFRLALARAREERAHAWAEEVVDISDDGSRDYKEIEQDGKKRMVVDHDHIQRSKLRVETRLKVMAKHAPSLYGERVALEHSGKDGAPLTPVINVTIGGSEPSSAS